MAIQSFNRDNALINNEGNVRALGRTPAFPSDIAGNSLVIHVFDTPNISMVNAGLSGGQVEVLKTLKGAFSDVVSQTSQAIQTHSAQNKKLVTEYKDAFKLPLPNEISENMSHTYGEETGWADSIIKKTGVGNAAIPLLESGAALHAKATGSQAYKYYENKIQMYQESAFRTISLSWTLVPYNEQEAKNLHEIIRKLKMYSSPETLAGKLILRSPHFFRLDFDNKVLNDALKFEEVNITSIDVAYSPGGNMELFHDDMPKSVELSITFQDREPKTQADWGSKKIETQVGQTC